MYHSGVQSSELDQSTKQSKLSEQKLRFFSKGKILKNAFNKKMMGI